MVFLRTYLQLIVLLLALDTLIFRSANSSTSDYYDSLSRAYPKHHLGAIAHFCNAARHDRQIDSGQQSFIRHPPQCHKCHYSGI